MRHTNRELCRCRHDDAEHAQCHHTSCEDEMTGECDCAGACLVDGCDCDGFSRVSPDEVCCKFCGEPVHSNPLSLAVGAHLPCIDLAAGHKQRRGGE